jgi:hypothetical protein
MFETKITISVVTEQELTDEEVCEIMVMLKYRSEGYTTEYPECMVLKKAQMSILRNYKQNTLS